ncbi:MAG: class B sortase [Clostridia bacterium]|nr:class B sortase [Clostridia bacterium]
MSKKTDSRYVYFSGSEETVIRADETKKLTVTKAFKKKKLKKTALNLVSLVLIVSILVSSLFLGKRGIERFLVLRQEEKRHEEASLPSDVIEKLDNMTDEQKWEYLYKKYPDLINVKFPARILVDYALYYAQNPQTVGYIKIDGTKIDSPVVQADNNKYYLNHDFYGKATSYGAIYASYKNSFQPFDRNTLLYGHNMHDGSRFADLLNYKNLEYFKKHPIIQFDSLYEKNYWKICAVVITNGSTESDNGYFFDFTFNHCSDLCYEEYIGELEKRKLYETGVDVLPTDRLLTLCTCTYEYDDARLLVIARMVRKGENPVVDTAFADYKSTPVKYPDSYYDNPNSNPYKNDKKFYLY